MSRLIKKFLINAGVFIVLLMLPFPILLSRFLWPVLKMNDYPQSSKNIRISQLVGAYECSYSVKYCYSDNASEMPAVRSAFLEQSYKKRAPFNPNLILIPGSYNLNLILEDKECTDDIYVTRGTDRHYLSSGASSFKFNVLPSDTIHFEVSCGDKRQNIILTRIEP